MDKILRYIFILPLVAVMMSCGDDEPTAGIEIYQDVMTFDGNRDGCIHLLFQAIDDSEPIDVYSPGSLSGEGVEPGLRVLVTYSLPTDRTYPSPGQIQLRSIGRVSTPQIETATDIPTADDLNPIYVNTLYRTGHYINLRATMPKVTGRTYQVCVDESSLSTGTAVLTIDTEVPQGATGYDALSVMSVDISEIWDRSDIQAIDVTINNSNNIYRRKFTFNK